MPGTLGRRNILQPKGGGVNGGINRDLVLITLVGLLALLWAGRLSVLVLDGRDVPDLDAATQFVLSVVVGVAVGERVISGRSNGQGSR